MTSPTGRQSGLTLLEILITLGILALFTGAFFLQFDDSPDGELLEKAARELKSTALLAKKKSRAFKQDQILRFEGRRFFLVASPPRREEQGFQEISQELASYTLPEGVEIEFLLFGETRWVPMLEYDWRFRSSGLSDALGVRFSTGRSFTILQFNALTGRAEEEMLVE